MEKGKFERMVSEINKIQNKRIPSNAALSMHPFLDNIGMEHAKIDRMELVSERRMDALVGANRQQFDDQQKGKFRSRKVASVDFWSVADSLSPSPRPISAERKPAYVMKPQTLQPRPPTAEPGYYTHRRACSEMVRPCSVNTSARSNRRTRPRSSKSQRSRARSIKHFNSIVDQCKQLGNQSYRDDLVEFQSKIRSKHVIDERLGKRLEDIADCLADNQDTDPEIFKSRFQTAFYNRRLDERNLKNPNLIKEAKSSLLKMGQIVKHIGIRKKPMFRQKTGAIGFQLNRKLGFIFDKDRHVNN